MQGTDTPVTLEIHKTLFQIDNWYLTGYWHLGNYYNITLDFLLDTFKHKTAMHKKLLECYKKTDFAGKILLREAVIYVY